MTALSRVWTGVVWATVLSAGAAHAQGRGGGAWPTTGGDAQRTASQRTDPKISVEAMQKPGFQFLWKRKFGEASTRAQLSQPLLLPNIIAYKGFKALAFVSTSGDTVHAVDYELNRMFWSQRLATASKSAGSGACAAGAPAITKATAVAPPAPGARGRGAGAGGGGGGRGAAPTGPVMPGGRDAGENVVAISSGGMVHLMNPQVGTDQMPPIKFLPPNVRVVGSILTGNVLYAATTGLCGGAANGVWALDVLGDAKAVTTFDTKGAGIAGAVAPTFGTDGTMYVATGSGDSTVANAVVSLEAKTLQQKDSFTAGASPFVSAPVVFQHKGKDLVAALNRNGRLYLLDAASLGGADHQTPLASSTPFAGPAGEVAGLSTWLDAAGTRWIAATSAGALAGDTKFAMSNGAVTTGAVVAFTVVDANAAPTLQPQWASGDIRTPTTPLLLNGVLFALTGAEAAAAGRGARALPAVLHALDAATGKTLWTSGTSITSPARGAGPSGGDSQVYVAAEDGTLYAFGMPAER